MAVEKKKGSDEEDDDFEEGTKIEHRQITRIVQASIRQELAR